MKKINLKTIDQILGKKEMRRIAGGSGSGTIGCGCCMCSPGNSAAGNITAQHQG